MMNKSRRHFIKTSQGIIGLAMAANAGVTGKALDASQNQESAAESSSCPVDPSKVILTFTCSQWYNMPDAMQRMAEVVHAEGVPVNWQLGLEIARKQHEILTAFHEKFGDDIVVHGHGIIPDFAEWRRLFPWSKINIAGVARHNSSKELSRRAKNNIEGEWGFCDQQIGVDGITHWGCPWGMFYLSEKTEFTPAQGKADMVGIPWTLRDLHKVYHTGQAINFAFDPIEMIRSRNLDWGRNITYFQKAFDELVANTPWNERVYCCLHEEANGPFIFPGKQRSDEGADKRESEAMYDMIAAWLRFAKQRGATVMTLPQAVADYKAQSGDRVMPSTLLTRDKFHGRIRYYIPPFPPGVRADEFGTAGHQPDTLFHFDQDCQLVFVHPEILPRHVLNYQAEHVVDRSKPYPKEQVLPALLDWKCSRKDDLQLYEYVIQKWYNMPFGLVEWGDFDDWEIVETNGISAKIINRRALFLRVNLTIQDTSRQKANEQANKGQEFFVKLRRTT